jgi:ATP-binding cassette subfamily F protein 3
MLSVRNVHLARGDQPIFEGLSFAVHPGQKVGIVGANGIGKSTLFALLRRKLHAESGEVDIPATWRIGYMAQEVEPSARTALEFVIDGCTELRQAERELERALAAPATRAVRAGLVPTGQMVGESVVPSTLNPIGSGRQSFASSGL